jgi:hypothetical protein
VSRHSRPGEPRYRRKRPSYATGTYRASDQWSIALNLFRMWRDFPGLGLGEFIDKALTFGHEAAAHGREFGSTRAGLGTVRDDVLEQVCYRYWVHKSRRVIRRDVRERWQ